MGSSHHPLSFGTVSVQIKGGSLQITVPTDLARIMRLQAGDEVRISFDPATEEMFVSRELTRIVGRKEARILYLLQKAGVYLPKRHYQLASGRHSPDYAHVRLALANDEIAEEIGQVVAETFSGEKIDAIAGFTVGGLLLAKATCQILNARLIVGEKIFGKDKETDVAFYNLDLVEEGDNILLVDDVITTGGSLNRAINAIKKQTDKVPVAVAVVVDRSQGKTIDLNVSLVRLTTINFEEYAPDNCPMCKAGSLPIDLSKAEVSEKTTLATLPEEKREMMAKGYEVVRELISQAKSKRP